VPPFRFKVPGMKGKETFFPGLTDPEILPYE